MSSPVPLPQLEQSNFVGEPSRRVLIVDDEPALAEVFSTALEAVDLNVVRVHSSAEATRLLRAEEFQVVVSDISMPGLSGIELLRTARRYDPDVPVVLVTGKPDVRTAIRAVEYGAFRYLEKPVDLDAFKQVVRHAVQVHELARIRRKALTLLRNQQREVSDRTLLDASLTDVIDTLQMEFQPIVRCSSRTLHGYEALLRSSNPALSSPAAVLGAAERLQRVHELGRRIRYRVATAMEHVPGAELVFVNLHPWELSDEELYQLAAPLSRHASRVVLEVTERACLEQVANLDARITRLRRLGYRLAVDDLGSGYSGLASFIRLEPDFVKIDMTLTRSVDSSPTKQSLLRATFDVCRELGIEVVGEGVETRDELGTLLRIGAELLQGHLFGRPSRDFRDVPKHFFDT